MEGKLNRIVIRDGEYTNVRTVSKLVSDASVQTEFNLKTLTLICNALGQMVENDDNGHVDLFVLKKPDENFLCANLYTVYLTMNRLDHTLGAFQTAVNAANSMVCRAVDEDTLVLQLRFRL